MGFVCPDVVERVVGRDFRRWDVYPQGLFRELGELG